VGFVEDSEASKLGKLSGSSKFTNTG